MSSPGTDDLLAQRPRHQDLITAPHHGSADPVAAAEPLSKWATPSATIVQADHRWNTAATEATYGKQGVVYHTADTGAVKATIDKDGTRVETYLPLFDPNQKTGKAALRGDDRPIVQEDDFQPRDWHGRWTRTTDPGGDKPLTTAAQTHTKTDDPESDYYGMMEEYHQWLARKEAPDTQPASQSAFAGRDEPARRDPRACPPAFAPLGRLDEQARQSHRPGEDRREDRGRQSQVRTATRGGRQESNPLCRPAFDRCRLAVQLQPWNERAARPRRRQPQPCAHGYSAWRISPRPGTHRTHRSHARHRCPKRQRQGRPTRRRVPGNLLQYARTHHDRQDDRLGTARLRRRWARPHERRHTPSAGRGDRARREAAVRRRQARRHGGNRSESGGRSHPRQIRQRTPHAHQARNRRRRRDDLPRRARPRGPMRLLRGTRCPSRSRRGVRNGRWPRQRPGRHPLPHGVYPPMHRRRIRPPRARRATQTARAAILARRHQQGHFPSPGKDPQRHPHHRPGDRGRTRPPRPVQVQCRPASPPALRPRVRTQDARQVLRRWRKTSRNRKTTPKSRPPTSSSTTTTRAARPRP